MRRKRWETMLTQFTYDHRQINDHLSKLHTSAGELNKILNSIPQKGNEKKEDKEKE